MYYAIEKLQEEGFIELNESFFHPSKVTINIDKTELYKFQIANSTLDPLIKALLRLFGGELFGNLVRISENQLARMLNTTTYKIKNQLDLLNKMKVITYDRMRDKPQLAFMTPRYDAAKLPVNMQRLKERRKIQQEKLDAILHYVENEHQCRTGMILDYFGEHSFQDCGHCDRCIEKKRKLSASDQERIREMVQYQLTKGPKLPEELTSMFEDHEIPLVEEIIREMTDRDVLGYDQLGRLVVLEK